MLRSNKGFWWGGM